jgi:hypothetical protein
MISSHLLKKSENTHYERSLPLFFGKCLICILFPDNISSRDMNLFTYFFEASNGLISESLKAMETFREEALFHACRTFLTQLLIALDPLCHTFIQEWVSELRSFDGTFFGDLLITNNK